MAGEAIGTGAAANVGSSIFIKIVKEVKTVVSVHQAVRGMEAKVRHLSGGIDDIKKRLSQEQGNPKQIVKIWLDEAEKGIRTSQSIKDKYQQSKYCLFCCPNIVCWYRISKDIRHWEQNVAKLELERSNFPPGGEYVDSAPPTQMPIEIPKSGFTGDAIRSAQSRIETWLTLDSSEIRTIGIYGMGGVGKTSLVQTINNSQKVSNLFDLIIWVTVSKDYTDADLQSCVADRLKLKNFPEKSNFEGRKNMLCSYLKEKKFLLILDDMWKSLDLRKLGASSSERGSKIILTTRNKAVCTGMDAEEMIPVDPLTEDEGWELFRTRAFRNGDVPADKEDVAKEIAKECKGLPLAIIVIAAAMAHYPYRHEWELALHQMQTIDERFYDTHDEVEEKLFQHLKWSYNVLPADYLKTCFVYFAAYPEDRIIMCEEVIEMWIAEGLEGLVKGVGQSYLHDTAHSFISLLRDRCLIQATKTDITGRIEQVKIHDVLRDLATLIAQKEHKCFFKSGQNVRDFPVEEDTKGWARMSLMKNTLRSLPITFTCSSVLVLTLRVNPGIDAVPGSFLQGMPSLRVLDLSDTRITSLPSSIGDMKQLASLQLFRTGIRELPESIGDLNRLQFLNVGFCEQLQCLPKRITELKSLRALDIWGCKKLSFLPRGISELVSLERLRMKMSIPLDFEEAPGASAERSYACLKDLQNLSSLRNFAVEVKSPVKEGVIGSWSMMRNLWLDFNRANQDKLPQDMKKMKDHLELFCLCRCDLELLPNWISDFRKLAYLLLKSCKRLKELPVELLELPGLRGLSIEDCDTLKEMELGRPGCFTMLEKLSLKNLKSFDCLQGATSSSRGLGDGTLPMLKSFTVNKCEKLKTLPLGWDKLKYLEEIRGEKDWWDAIQWQDVNLKTSLESKFRSW